MIPCICFLALTALASQVSSQSSQDQALQDLSNRNADFAARLYRLVASRSDDNVLLSPLTLSVGLSALLSAAAGPTQDQLLQGLTLSGLEATAIPDLFQSLRTPATQGGGASNLRQGVAIFPAPSIQVSAAYQDLVQTKYGGHLQTLTYTTPQDAIDNINRWADQATGGQVQELVQNLDPQTQLLMATAAAYQTRFSLSFNSSLTQDERFYVDRYHIRMVPMMFRAGKFFLAYDRSVRAGVLRLPMTDGAAMLVVLPDEGVDISTVEEEVTGEKVRAWIQQLKKTKLEVQLPRFMLESSYTLNSALQSLDITQLFEDNADLSNMSGAKAKVTKVLHKVAMSADESSDSDVSGGGASGFSSPPPRLTINRPFLFVVYQQSATMLLMGRVIDPTKK